MSMREDTALEAECRRALQRIALMQMEENRLKFMLGWVYRWWRNGFYVGVILGATVFCAITWILQP
jgi:hypothetical protein